jgi:hypothetical protein
MPKPSDVFANFEGDIVRDIDQLNEAAEKLYKKRLAHKPTALFAFRGAGDADWGFHSSLYRRVWGPGSSTPPLRPMRKRRRGHTAPLLSERAAGASRASAKVLRACPFDGGAAMAGVPQRAGTSRRERDAPLPLRPCTAHPGT